jgi:hypothetical protein
MNLNSFACKESILNLKEETVFTENFQKPAYIIFNNDAPRWKITSYCTAYAENRQFSLFCIVGARI